MTSQRTEEAQLEEEIGEDRVRLWPDLSYWYGIGPLDLAVIPNAVRRVYERAIPRIRAQHLRLAMDASGYPHMEKADAQKMVSRVNSEMKQGLPEPSATKPKTAEEMAGLTAAAGIGLVEVGPDGMPKEEE